jgi:hypothetical protein
MASGGSSTREIFDRASSGAMSSADYAASLAAMAVDDQAETSASSEDVPGVADVPGEDADPGSKDADSGSSMTASQGPRGQKDRSKSLLRMKKASSEKDGEDKADKGGILGRKFGRRFTKLGKSGTLTRALVWRASLLTDSFFFQTQRMTFLL